MHIVLEAEIGSTAYGLNTAASDHDYVAVYLEPAETLFGIAPESKTCIDRPRTENAKSQAGDHEQTLYPLRKFASLAAQGNPSVMSVLFSPLITVPDAIGLRICRDMFMSKKILSSHLGYSDSLVAQLTGKRKPQFNRPELVSAHGWDTKAGRYAAQLLMQSIAMARTGSMVLPMAGNDLEFLKQVRDGELSFDVVLARIEKLKSELHDAESSSALSDAPDYEVINSWLIRAYREHLL